MTGPLRRRHVLAGIVAAVLVVGPVQSHATAAGQARAADEAAGTSTSPERAAYSGPLRTSPAAAGAFRVAVFGELSGFDPRAIAATLNTDPRIDAVPVGRARVAGGLTGFRVLVARFAIDTPTRAMVTGLRQFVARGGGYVGEYWGAGATLTEIGRAHV